jgi:hydrogenase/urease accessory protein HupE
LLAALLTVLLTSARAHPVAQGSVDLSIEPDALRASFRVSNEQIFVASTFAGGGAPAASLDEMWQSHAAYLLGHIHVSAGAGPLKGELLRVEPPEDKTTNGFTRYEVRFPVGSPAPATISIRQNLLNEIEFAPGNPWEASFVARISKDGEVVEEARLLGPKQPLEFAFSSSATAVSGEHAGGLGRLAREFFSLGLEHIFGGWDHILFVVALVFAVPRIGQVVALVTAFTFAHTITITLAVLRLVHLPSSFVEPMIAGSILVAAALNFFPKTETSLKPRLAVAFGFGLFHGLGFAGALVDAMQGFSTRTLATAIASFSAGVEVGHQTVVIPLLAVMFILRRWAVPSVPWAARIGSAAVMLAGGWMLVLTLR